MNNQIRIAKFKYLTNVTNCVPIENAEIDDITKYSPEAPFLLVATEDIYDNNGKCVIQKGQVSKETPGYAYDPRRDITYAADDNNKVEELLAVEAKKRFLSQPDGNISLTMTDQIIDIDNINVDEDIIINGNTYQYLGMDEETERIVSIEDIYKDGKLIVKSGEIGAEFKGDNKNVEFYNSWATFLTQITNNTDSFNMIFDNSYVAQTKFTEIDTEVTNIGLTNTTVLDSWAINYNPSDNDYSNHGMNLNNSTINMSEIIIQPKNYLNKTVDLNNITANYSKMALVLSSDNDAKLSINNLNVKNSNISAVSKNVNIDRTNISNSKISVHKYNNFEITDSGLSDTEFDNTNDKSNNVKINNSSVISTNLTNNVYVSNSTCYGGVSSQIDLEDSRLHNVNLNTRHVPMVIKNSDIDIDRSVLSRSQNINYIIEDTIQDLGRYSNKLIEINQGELNTFDIGNYYEKSIKELEQKENSPSKSTPSVDLEL